MFWDPFFSVAITHRRKNSFVQEWNSPEGMPASGINSWQFSSEEPRKPGTKTPLEDLNKVADRSYQFLNIKLISPWLEETSPCPPNQWFLVIHWFFCQVAPILSIISRLGMLQQRGKKGRCWILHLSAVAMPRGVSCKYRVQTQRCRNNGDWNVCSVNSVEFWAGDGSWVITGQSLRLWAPCGAQWREKTKQNQQDFLIRGEEQQRDPWAAPSQKWNSALPGEPGVDNGAGKDQLGKMGKGTGKMCCFLLGKGSRWEQWDEIAQAEEEGSGADIKCDGLGWLGPWGSPADHQSNSGNRQHWLQFQIWQGRQKFLKFCCCLLL